MGLDFRTGGDDRQIEAGEFIDHRVARDELPRDAKSLAVHDERLADDYAGRNGNALKSLHRMFVFTRRRSAALAALPEGKSPAAAAAMARFPPARGAGQFGSGGSLPPAAAQAAPRGPIRPTRPTGNIASRVERDAAVMDPQVFSSSNSANLPANNSTSASRAASASVP